MLKKVYDEQGNEFELEAVDAREYVETGRYFEQPPVKEVQQESAKGKK